MTTRPDHDHRRHGHAGPGSDPVRWRSDHDYSASWSESQFADHWRAQDGHETGELTLPMCSLCGLFIRPTPRPSSPDETRQDDRQDGGEDPDRDDDDDDDDDSNHEMDDNFHSTNRFEHIADDRSENEDSNGGREDDDNDEDDETILTPADVLQFFMSHHQSSVLMPDDDDDGDDDDDDDVRSLERHREAVERHIIEAHGAPSDYSLDQKDFLPPRPNPSIYVSVTLPKATTTTAVRTADEIFDVVCDRFPDLKVGAVPRKTVHGWARVLAQGLGRETRSLQGTLGELLQLCYELHWRKANTVWSP